METLGIVLGLAVLVESITEYIAGVFWLPGTNGNRTKIMTGIAIASGVIVAIVFQANLLPILGINSPFSEIPGQIITGIILSRGADFVHQIIKRVKPV